jgi:beta-fructofuranosidase
MLRLPSAWTWDFWLADDGGRYHLFFLFAPRALQDEQRRHRRAAIGHAVSDDLRRWVQVGDVVAASPAPAFDDLATWTGSVVRGHDGRWWLFYTGATLVDDQIRQTIGAATSTDLDVWRKHPASPLVTADDRWYERLGGGIWPEEAWRDPWVLADPDGDGWHMLITARANHGPVENRGVIGHAVSPDLQRWEVWPPLSKPGSGFNYLECPQVATVEDRHVLLFRCLDPQPSTVQRAAGTGASGMCRSTRRQGPSTSPQPAR